MLDHPHRDGLLFVVAQLDFQGLVDKALRLIGKVVGAGIGEFQHGPNIVIALRSIIRLIPQVSHAGLAQGCAIVDVKAPRRDAGSAQKLHLPGFAVVQCSWVGQRVGMVVVKVALVDRGAAPVSTTTCAAVTLYPACCGWILLTSPAMSLIGAWSNCLPLWLSSVTQPSRSSVSPFSGATAL